MWSSRRRSILKSGLILAGFVALLAAAATGMPMLTSAAAPAGHPSSDTPIRYLRAQIELYVQFSSESPNLTRPWDELWSTVQWQDAQGDWHEVEGWRATVEPMEGTFGKVWGVAAKDYGRGPFRWVIEDNRSAKVLAVSEPFFLPSGIGQATVVTVGL